MKKSCVLSILLLLFTSEAFTQRFLTLDDCRNLAIENNKNLKIATQEEKAAYYQKKEAFTKYFPELSFSGTYLRNEKNLNLLSSSAIPTQITLPDLTGIGIPFPGATIPIGDEYRKKIKDAGEIDIKNVWVAGFSLVQPVFMGGKIIAYNDIQKYAEELAKSKKDTKLTDVIVETDNAYWQIVSLSNKERLAESYVELLRKMESDIIAMEEEGLATKADRLSVSVKLNEAEMTLTKAENGLSLAKMYLSQICGLDISDQITLQDEQIKTLNVVEETIPVSDVNEAIANRDEIKSLQLATKIYKKQETISRSEFMPQVAFTASYLWTNPSSFDGFETKFGGMWNLGVAVKVPLNIFSSAAKLNTAKANSRIAQYQLDDAKEKIELQVNQSTYKLNEANKKLKMSTRNMEKADENLRYANTGFEEGVIPASDALSAHTAWMSAHSEFIDAQIDVKLCKLYLDQAMGRVF
ncbi:MAG: TolC family protein [Dysgonomonas sp.]